MSIVALKFGSRQGNIYLAYKINRKYSRGEQLGGQSRQPRQDSSLTMGIFDCRRHVNFIFREGNCGNLFINTIKWASSMKQCRYTKSS